MACWIRKTARSLALLLVPTLLLAACSNASSSTSSGNQTEGVSSNEIDVGGIAASTGPLADQYSPIFGAVQAYFDMVNAQGGVNGRKLKYVAQLDDQSLPSLDVSQARALVEQDHVFAIVGVATPLFAAGKYLGQTGVPTFGWNVNPEWSDGPNLFGDKGSYLDFTNQGPELAFIASKVGATRVGVIAYTVQQSAECATGVVKLFHKFHLDVVLQDTSLPFGFTDISGDVNKLKNSGAQFVATCMDPTGNTTLSQGLQEAGLYNKVAQYWPNGYDQVTLNKYAPLMQGVYFSTGNVPYAHGYTQGMDGYLDAMGAHNLTVGDVTLAGWINADLFVTGLRKLGHDVTRQGLINVINKMKNYTAGGITPGIDWTQQHTGSGSLDCTAFLQARGTQFVPAFATGKDPFVCFQGPHADTLQQYPFPGDASTFFNSPLPPPSG